MRTKSKSRTRITQEPLAAAIRRWQGDRIQKEAAFEMGVSVRTYQNWIQGRRRPKGLTLKTVKQILSSC